MTAEVPAREPADPLPVHVVHVDVSSAAPADAPPRPSPIIRVGQFFFKFRNYVSPLVVLALVLAFPPIRIENQRLDLSITLAGVFLVLLGQSLRVAVIGYAYIKRGGKDKEVYADRLVQQGFFAHSRNPLYVGNLLVMFGIFVVYDSIGVYAFGIAFFLFLYLTIVAAEEDYLSRKFGGEYADYCRRVNRFIPDPRGLSKSLEGMAFDWRRVIRKEYGTIFANAATLIAVLAWRQHRLTGKASIPLMLMILPAIVFYGLSRWAKKTNRLGSD